MPQTACAGCHTLLLHKASNAAAWQGGARAFPGPVKNAADYDKPIHALQSGCQDLTARSAHCVASQQRHQHSSGVSGKSTQVHALPNSTHRSSIRTCSSFQEPLISSIDLLRMFRCSCACLNRCWARLAAPAERRMEGQARVVRRLCSRSFGLRSSHTTASAVCQCSVSSRAWSRTASRSRTSCRLHRPRFRS